MSHHPEEITDDQFEEAVIHSDLPVLVDFWAPWCGPCRLVAPILEELASAHSETLKVAKVNTDEHQVNALGYGVQAIPTMILFNNGSEVSRAVGALPRAQLEDWLRLELGDGATGRATPQTPSLRRGKGGPNSTTVR